MIRQKDIDEQIAIISKFRCEEILNWAKDNDWFNRSFVEEMYDKLEKGVKLSAGQVSALKNVHESFVA